MKHIILLFLFPILNYGQNYNGPESIEYSPNSASYFISNSGNGQVLELDNNNNLSIFVNNLQAGPHGLELVQQDIGTEWSEQFLYACSGGQLYGYDFNGNEILNYDLNGSFLNGITHRINTSSEVDLFITDFSAKKLYQYSISENMHYEICSFSKNPNGVYYDAMNNRLLVVCWGWNAPIYDINISEGTYTTIINTGLANIDGITMDQCGNLYISVWGTNSIHKYNSDFSESEIIIDGLNNPADIYYNTFDNIIAIPNSGNNTIDLIPYSCDNSNTEEIESKKNIFKKIDLLGRETVQSKFILEIYEDGSIEKKYLIK
tara:strand:+ start:1636 stop:2589 length:954 start_codon:yes stop_codon:yes gene_type:complete